MANCSMAELNYVENDTLPELECTYSGVDITGYTFELHIQYDPALVIAGIIVEASEGTFKFGFSTGDIRTGKWNAEIQITDSDGKILTFQGLKFNVAPEIA